MGKYNNTDTNYRHCESVLLSCVRRVDLAESLSVSGRPRVEHGLFVERKRGSRYRHCAAEHRLDRNDGLLQQFVNHHEILETSPEGHRVDVANTGTGIIEKYREY